MEKEKEHIVPYYQYGIILVVLLTCTFLSVAVTSIELGELTVTVALILASVKSFFVLVWFMHLKFDKTYIRLMVAGIFLLFLVVTVITFLDYLYR